MILRWFLISCGAALAAVLLVLTPSASQAATGDTISVHRGAVVSQVRLSPGGALKAERGPALKVSAYTGKKTAKPRNLIAGERLWIVDRQASRLTACILKRTTQLGQRRIHCFKRALPASLAP